MAIPDHRPRRASSIRAAVPWILLALILGGVAVLARGRWQVPGPRRLGSAARDPARTREAPAPTELALAEEPPADEPSLDPAATRTFGSAPAGPSVEFSSRWSGSLLLKDSATMMEIQYAASSVFVTTVGTRNNSLGRTIYAAGQGARVPIPNDQSWIMFGPKGLASEDAPAAPDANEENGWVDILVPGYAAKRVAHPENGAEVEVLLDPWTLAVRGVVEVPGVEDAWIAMRLLAPNVRGGGSPRLAGPMEHPGPFEISDMPSGEYELLVQARTASGTFWARRRIVYLGVPLDLGIIAVDGASGIRARKVDPEGRALFDSAICAELLPGKGRAIPLGSPYDSIKDSIPSARPAPDEDGWVELAGLLPGGAYAVQSQEAGPVGLEAVAPEENGAFAEVTLVRAARAVRCTLRFTFKGEAPAFWKVVNCPFPDEAWTGPGVFAGELLPGRYSVGLRVNTVDKDPGHATWVNIEVPEGGEFDKAYDLR